MPRTLRAELSFIICISAPSSTPYGCGWISCRFLWQLLRDALVSGGLVLGRRAVLDLDVRIDQRGLLHVVVHRAASLLVDRLELDLDRVPRFESQSISSSFWIDRGVLLGIDGDAEQVGRLALARARDDLHRAAGGELPVHARGGDADALLSALLLEPVEFRAVEQLAEDLGDLLLDDAGAVVLHATRKRFSDRPPRSRSRDRAGCPLPRRHRASCPPLRGPRSAAPSVRIVEAQQVAVLGEELGDRDLALAGSHGLCVLALPTGGLGRARARTCQDRFFGAGLGRQGRISLGAESGGHSTSSSGSSGPASGRPFEV